MSNKPILKNSLFLDRFEQFTFEHNQWGSFWIMIATFFGCIFKQIFLLILVRFLHGALKMLFVTNMSSGDIVIVIVLKLSERWQIPPHHFLPSVFNN